MSSYVLSLLLAVVACVIGGALGGIALARPAGLAGSADGQAGPAPRLTEARTLGGLLIVSHAGAALYLGYQPSVGAAMAFVLALAWFGAALGQIASVMIDPTEGRPNLGNLAFALLIAATLALPFLNPARLVLRGGMMV